MASFEKRVNQKGETRWRMKVFVGVDAKGKRKFITQTFATRREAEQEARKLETRKDKGALTLPSKDSVATYLRRWLEDVMIDQVRERTWAGYSGTLRRYVEEPPKGAPSIGHLRVDRLTPEAIQRLYTWLRRERGLSPRTIRSLHAVLRQGLAHAARTGAAPRNPAGKDLVKPPKLQRKEIRAMTPEEADRFMEAAREDRYAALWILLLTGGLRPGEALGLKWDDVDFERSRVHVERSLARQGVKGWKLTAPKTTKSQRVVVLPPVAVQGLRDWRKVQAAEQLKGGADYRKHGFVFTTASGEPLDGTNLSSQNFARIMRRAGLGTLGEEPAKPRRGPRGRRAFRPAYRMYDLRHTCATMLLRDGENPKIVSERLGHASTAFTMDVYTASLPDLQESAADKMEARFGRGG